MEHRANRVRAELRVLTAPAVPTAPQVKREPRVHRVQADRMARLANSGPKVLPVRLAPKALPVQLDSPEQPASLGLPDQPGQPDQLAQPALVRCSTTARFTTPLIK